MISDKENALVASRVGLLLAAGMLAFFALGWGFRGYDQARLALALVPVAAGLAVATAGYLGLRQARVPAVGVARPGVEPAPLGVTVTVREAEGACPLGYAMQAGDRWTVQGDLEGAAGLCPRARQAVAVYLEDVRFGRTPSELPACLTKKHNAVFEVAWQESAKEPVLAR